MNIQEAVKKGQIILKSKNIESAELDSQILMSEALKKSKKYLILNFQEKVMDKQLIYFNSLISQRAVGKPIAYLLKKKIFGNMNFL